MIKIHKPIIIVCTGRSGSTMFYRILASHKSLGWLSTYNQIFPTHLWLSSLSNLYRLRILDRIRNEYFFPKPFSPYKFWEHYLPGMARRDRPLTADDVPPEAIEPVRCAIARVLRYQNRDRFLTKVTGWARIAYFNRIFPDALFIYLRRKPIDVVSSWIRAGWLDVTSAPGSDTWEWGEIPEAYYEAWKELGKNPCVSAAVKTQLDIDDIIRNITQFKTRCYVLQYENLISEPIKYLREVIDFCELNWDEDFERVVQSTTFHNNVNKWKRYLSEEDGNLILEFFNRFDHTQARLSLLER